MSLLPPLLFTTSLEVTAVVAMVAAVLLRVLHHGWWRARGLRPALLAVVVFMLLCHAAWAVGLHAYVVSYWGAAVASCLLVLMVLTVASLPLAALVRFLGARLLATAPAAAPTSAAASSLPPANAARRIDRRTLLQAATISVPLAALGTGLRGLSSASVPVRAPLIPFAYPGLHRDLEGFTILQLSDLHLGMTKGLGDLDRFLERVANGPQRPDLIVLTGDIAEDLSLLGPALSLVDQVRPRAGVLACLGNHEYLRDIRVSRPIFDRSPVPLLVDEGLRIKVGAAHLYVGGTDDPVITHADIRPYFRGAVERAMRDADADSFRLLLAHRPEAFDTAQRHGVHLTLSGHTHGGQIGFNGKSAFEPLWRDGYLWGSYARERSRLYTTSGFGDWFPFRLGCPAEAPRLVLTRSG
jgi:predicted MPP superfamily phosphohydrolase